MSLVGELVALRPLEPADAEALWRWSSDPDVIRWMDGVYPQSLAQAMARGADRPRNDFSNVLLGITPRSEPDRLVGVVRLRDAEPEQGRAELDLYLGDKDCWGRGYATDATRTVCRYGFGRMRLHLIALWVVADNVAARRVYEKVGFQEVGRHREAFRGDDGWHDMVLMDLLEGDLRRS